jgi:hypothetical protein
MVPLKPLAQSPDPTPSDSSPDNEADYKEADQEAWVLHVNSVPPLAEISQCGSQLPGHWGSTNGGMKYL